MNGNCPEYLKKYLPSKQYSLNNERSNLFRIFISHTEYYKNSFFPFCVNEWNKLQSLTKILRQIADLQQKLTFQAIWKVLIFSLEMTRLLKIEKWLEASALGCHPAKNGHVTH